MKPLKIAVMGAGLIGRRHAERIISEPGTLLSAVIDPSSAGHDFARNAGARWYANFRDISEEDRPYGVIVATPNQLHVENAMEIIAAGIPVLVEKPIADDVDAAAALVAAGEKAGIPILVGHHRRYNPMIQAAKQIVDGGRLGRIIAVHGTFWVAKPDDYFDISWRREAGAGPIFVNLIHDVDLFRFLFGEVEAVQAMESHAVRHHAVEDTAVVSLRFANGVLATLNGSDAVAAPWSWEATTGENPAFPRYSSHCYQIGGTKGSLAIPDLTLWTATSKPNWLEPLAEERVPFEAADPLCRQLRHFCDVIRGDAAPLVSGREGLATLRVVEAIKRSACSGQMVRLSDAVASADPQKV
ncbi:MULTISPECIES: Gfo/Idh/MocA family oxidoreductase [unclassified Rhizobium]|uniref:Gfo/Idh/MocA family protein n=1 Tax=unclassified Rhizobium TaxID=2613769 RepID=UPI001A997910|nr:MULTISPECIES: Gfo/Idh/MocA family oxidoreductase [unclassified Rhizobium]MBX5169751.1 Gfo/Idh/MocA family oxidoreductase [Rhizobium sp. NZLR1b]MBX5192726.1 Gfo/Idh/MocA family oxidoreductase [Rhizobium sp. NZLR3b]MBX5195876.1 Gfo/Idh/MocA family oxidoreductase [Rhizobium sp. NZLR10]MBX5201752.1 Gfo/Idh/MocA family oxidoreductase [Rhizobium sp. NZLR1]QSZ24409.1 Gfo/Idh/MocA family oxidoreductase [Rhizobium sp. NZLR1]